MSQKIVAEMVANVWRLLVSKGDRVEAGDTICILESMKMEIPVEAGAAGTVISVNVSEGGTVQEGDLIAVID